MKDRAEEIAGWIGVDLDGTLAEYHGFKGVDHIGNPIPAMVERVKQWLSEGKDVRIFTARVDGGIAALNAGNPAGAQFTNIAAAMRPIREWCRKHLGQELPITCTKDDSMIELWDDRCVQVVSNTGHRVDEALAEQEAREKRLRDALEAYEAWVERMLAEGKGIPATTAHLLHRANELRRTALAAHRGEGGIPCPHCLREPCECSEQDIAPDIGDQ